MTIRKIEKEDLQKCSKILERAYSRSPYNESFKENTSEFYILNKYDNCKDNSFVLLNEEQEIIAFVFLNISYWSDGKQAILEEIVVDPDFQNKGIGTTLLNYIFNYAKTLGVKSIMFWAKNNDRLLDFYKKHGCFEANDFVVMFKNF